eukprot:CAMPEP_0113484474 /NCGR_PEP_ID=MMETSP0014_2-20120614/23979_1 /TAXON_ID=2857 /ORGANISM="Nitzschia sp." /LENGTH=233 /DNA_ID=CAMNT_0000378075 /DNA_START=176 /DNA_END=877 /DNA_ORIENTATION=+ /assembly_acc=CAM_ASM_000159
MTSTSLFSSSSTDGPSSSTAAATTTSTTTPNIIQVSLEKPLGMILEEVEEGVPAGVYVKELADGGSASTLDDIDLVGLVVSKVNGDDMTIKSFDDVMETLIDSPSPVSLEFTTVNEGGEGDDGIADYDVGTEVTIKVVDDSGAETASIQAKVGDNLRQILLENNVEVYKGLKQKLGNCGGGGQCGFCVADFVETDGWVERSDYEAQKLKNNQPTTARLTCLNNIQGPATIRIL